jgi:hypothetical protein
MFGVRPLFFSPINKPEIKFEQKAVGKNDNGINYCGKNL